MEENNKLKIEYIKKSFELKKLKKYKEAIEYLYKALEVNSDDNDDVELLSQIGELHLILNNYDRAIDELQKVLTINSSNIFALQKLNEIYLKTNQDNKALKTAQKLCEIDRSAYSYTLYIKTLIKLNKIQDALEIFNSLSEDIKLDSNLLYLISTISKDKRKIFLERIISLDEYNKEANLDLATIAFEEGDYSKVVKYCLNLDEQDSPLASYYLGMIEAKKHNYQKAIELFTKAILFDNNEHDFYLDLSKSYIDLGWLNEASMALKKTINYSLINEDYEKLDEKYFLFSWISIKQKDYSKALLNLSSIKENSIYYPKAKILEQVVNLKTKNISCAKAVLEKYIEQEETNPILLDTLACVYKELKLYNKAIEIYSRAQEFYPESIYYTLEMIDLYIDINVYDKALELIEEFSSICSKCASIYNSKARIFYRKKDNLKALESIERCIELDKNNAESYYFRGLILNDLKEYEKAKTSIYTAIRLNPSIAKYYSQIARSYFEIGEYENALLYAKEAIEIDNNEINYKRQAYEIAKKLDNKVQIDILEKQLKRSEAILKLNR